MDPIYVNVPKKGQIVLPYQGKGIKNLGRKTNKNKKLEFVVEEVIEPSGSVEHDLWRGASIVTVRQLSSDGTTVDPNGKILTYFTGLQNRQPYKKELSIEQTPVVGEMEKIVTYKRK